MKKIKIVLIDDHQLIRMGIAALLNSEKEFDIVGETDSAFKVDDLIKETSPDIILMDISLDDGDGIELTKNLLKKDPALKVIILSMHVREDYIKRSLKAGALGYILKDSPKQDLIKAIKEVYRGGKYFASEVSQIMVQTYVNEAGEFKEKKRRTTGLTNRELEIIQLLSEGLNNQTIATKLDISHRTVDTHRTNIMQKVKVKNVAELIKYAIKNKLIEI